MTKSIFNQIALEAENVDGVAKAEIEFAIYGKMTNPNELQKATKVIKQLQASRKGVTAGSQIRVRRSQEIHPRTFKPLEEMQYILTAKAPSKEREGLDEVNSGCSEDLLKVFLSVAGEYMEKTRFVIPEKRISQAKYWEVDIFYDAEGSPIEWVKIDLEINDSSLKELPVLPNLGLTNVIISRAGKYKNAEEQQFVGTLYSDYFITKTV